MHQGCFATRTEPATSAFDPICSSSHDLYVPAMRAMQQQGRSESLYQLEGDTEVVPVGQDDSQPSPLDSPCRQMCSSSQGGETRSHSLGSWAALSSSQGLTPPPGGLVLPYPGDLGDAPTFSPSPTSRYRQRLELHAPPCTPRQPRRVSPAVDQARGTALEQPSPGTHTCMHGAHGESREAALQHLDEQLTGTVGCSWSQQGDLHGAPGSGMVADSSSTMTPTWEHALQPVRREQATRAQAEHWHDDVPVEGQPSMLHDATGEAASNIAWANLQVAHPLAYPNFIASQS